jgi:hypothetical protein
VKKIVVLVTTVLVLSAGVAADESRKLTGSYVWTGGGANGPLEAVFTPTGENAWDVAFHFEFDSRKHVYSGTAAGTLGTGELRGEVKNEQKNRTFTFEGSFADGTFKGTHAETTSGRSGSTGTLTMSAPSAKPAAEG